MASARPAGARKAQAKPRPLAPGAQGRSLHTEFNPTARLAAPPILSWSKCRDPDLDHPDDHPEANPGR